MTLICIQCAMEDFIAGRADMANAARFNETNEEHMARCHPDPAATQKRRRELETLIAQKLGGTMIYPDPKDNN